MKYEIIYYIYIRHSSDRRNAAVYSRKADYLKRNGWEVVVFYPGSNDENCAVTSLNRYVEGGNLLLDYRPAQLPKNLLKGVMPADEEVSAGRLYTGRVHLM